MLSVEPPSSASNASKYHCSYFAHIHSCFPLFLFISRSSSFTHREEFKLENGYSNEVIFEREAVVRTVEAMIKAGERVNGLMAILACW